MTHEEFVKKHNDGDISIMIDKDQAGLFYRRPYLLPRHIRIKLTILRVVAYLLLLAAPVLFFFTPWWIALIIIFFGVDMIVVCRKSGVKAVYEAVLTHSYAYQIALNNGTLKIKINTR